MSVTELPASQTPDPPIDSQLAGELAGQRAGDAVPAAPPRRAEWPRLALAGALPVSLTWGALIGAELGLPVLVAALAGALLLACLIVGLQRRVPAGGTKPPTLPRRERVLALITAGVTLGLGLLGLPPHETVLGGRDPGVYVNTAVTIATTGRISHIDSTLQDLGVRIGDWLLGSAPDPWVRPGMPGFQIFDLNAFAFQPHGFHAWPALLAAGYAGFGWAGLLVVPVLLRTWNLALAALIGRLIGGPIAGLLAVLLLGTNVGALWYGRSHAAEILVETFVLTGVLFGARAIRQRGAVDAVVAGAAFGAVHLTKIEYVQVPVIILLAVAILHAKGWSFRQLGWFVGPYSLLLVHAGLHAVLVAPAYTVGQVKGMLPRLDWAALDRADAAHPFVSAFWADLIRSNLLFVVTVGAVVLVLAGIAAWLAIGGRRYPKAFGVRGTPVLATLVTIILFVLLSRGAALAAPESVGPLVGFRFIGNPQSLREVMLYVGLLGLSLAGIGLLVAPFRARDAADRAVLGVLLVGAAPMLFVSWIADDHFWAGRRFVPILIPAVSIYAGAVIAWWIAWSRRRFRRQSVGLVASAAGIALAAAVVMSNLRATLPLYGHTENAGALTQVSRLARSLPDDGLVLMPWEEYSGLIITPLVVSHRQAILAVDSARIAEPGLTALYDRLHAQGKRLYWLGTQPPGLGLGLTAKEQRPVPFQVPRAEAPSGRLPATVIWWDVPLSLYEISAAPSGASQGGPNGGDERVVFVRQHGPGVEE